MKAATTRKTKAAKRSDRGVPFDEMRRLMRIYGSIKCLRKRQNPNGGEENTKIDSVKRKFYRWFPDLEERFQKDTDGYYRPVFGHEFEMRYREEMRMRDGEILAKKRARCRKERHGDTNGKTTKRNNTMPKSTTSAPSTMSKKCARVSPVVTPRGSLIMPISPDGTLSAPPSSAFNQGAGNGSIMDITLNFYQDPKMASAAITAGTEPVDRSFIAEQGIFDDVESSFFGPPPTAVPPTVQDCPSSSAWSSTCYSSSSSEEPASPVSSTSWESDHSSIENMDDMLEKSIEDSFEEMLGSDDSDSVSGYLFDMIHSS